MMPILLALFTANYKVYGVCKLWVAAEPGRPFPALQLYALGPRQPRAVSSVLDRSPNDFGVGRTKLLVALTRRTTGWALKRIDPVQGRPRVVRFCVPMGG
jgi:hypothetical protein